MSPNSPSDPRIDQAAITDESLLTVHEKLIGQQPDEKARYKLLPLNLLFVFSGLIFFAGTYLNRYAGRFDPAIYDPHGHPGGAPIAAAPRDPIKDGEKFFNAGACNTCHMANGMGQPGAIPPLVGSEWVVGSEERAIRIVLHGLQGPITVNGANYNSAMPPFGRVQGSGYNWDDYKVSAVLTYIRQAWGNQAPSVEEAKVTEIRNKEGNHKPWTAAELQQLQ